MKVAPVSVNYIHNIKPAKIKNISKSVVNNKALMSTAAASAVAAAALVKPATKEITLNDIEKKFTENGYTKGVAKDENNKEYPYLIKTFNENEKTSLKEKYGDFYEHHMGMVEEPLYEYDLDNMKNFLNIDKKRGKKIFNENFDDFLHTFLLIKNNGRLRVINEDRDKNLFTCVANIAENPMNAQTRKDFSDYQGKTYNGGIVTKMQKYLRGQSPLYKFSKDVQNHIKNMSQYIETQPLPENMKLYRGEGYEILSKVQLNNDKTVNLGKMMENALTSKNENEIKKVKEFIQDNELVAVQPSFMSTTTIGKMSYIDNIMWEFEADKGAKGIYLEGLNTGNVSSRLSEVLLQKGTKINIIDAEIVDNKWHIRAKISA